MFDTVVWTVWTTFDKLETANVLLDIAAEFVVINAIAFCTELLEKAAVLEAKVDPIKATGRVDVISLLDHAMLLKLTSIPCTMFMKPEANDLGIVVILYHDILFIFRDRDQNNLEKAYVTPFCDCSITLCSPCVLIQSRSVLRNVSCEMCRAKKTHY